MVASVKRLRIAAATVEYFEADGYYARGDPEHRKASGWYGAGAKQCGLANRKVTASAFASVLEGHVPRTDIRLGRLRDGEHQHLPGIDITFSAPKSFSLEALVYAPPHTRARLLNAHTAAVRATLDFLERELLQTRGYDRTTRRRPRVPAHGLLAALFRHSTNRNLDPQVHTHSVIANMTRNAAGEWRSAEFTAAFRAKKLLGAYYRTELQRRVEAIGYATVPTLVGRVPGFEIAGYPKALLERFSTRRRDLLAWLEAHGLEYTPANAQQAVLATRRQKAEPDREELAAIWQRQAKQCARKRDSRAVRRRGAPLPPAPSPLEIARRAVEHLAERSTLFAAHDLRGYALAYGGGRQTLPAIDEAIVMLQRDRLLLEVPADGVDRAFTTRGAAAAEREVLRRMQGGLDAGCVLADPNRVGATLAASPLNAGQRAAVQTVLLEPHCVVGVQGYAGTGKTTMLRELAGLAAGIPMLGLAPSTNAARVLRREAGIPTRTLQWFLVRHGDIADDAADEARLAKARAVHGGGLLIVDEASMIGTVAMVRLLRIADRVGVARVVLVGDRAQLRAVEAGQPFRLLQRAGMPTARMTEVLRQRNPALRTAVEHLIAERPALAIAELGPRVLEVGGDGDPDAELAGTMADLWLALDADARDRTLLLAPTHALRAEVHGAIRRRLADEGVLRGPTLTLDRYVNLHLTHAQKCELVHYREGDVLVFHQRDYGIGVEAGDACHVIGRDGGHVLLDSPDGHVRRMRPDRRIRYRFELYETRTIELRAGDRIRWTRPLRGDGLELDNGARATIRTIERRHVRFRADDGAEYALARTDPQLHHLDYAYTSTVHGAQGLTADSVIAILRADHGPLVDLKTAYVELSRARNDAVLLTDDREALGSALDQRSGEECSALEALGVQLPDPGRQGPPTPSALDVPRAGMPPPIADRPRLWAEAVPWWEFVEAARANSEEPFAAAGSSQAVAPVLALAAEPPAELPAGIVQVAAEHRTWRLWREQQQRAAEAAETRRREWVDQQRRGQLAKAARRLQEAETRSLRLLVARRRAALQRIRHAHEQRVGAALARQRQRVEMHLLTLARRERDALQAWRRRRIAQIRDLSRPRDPVDRAAAYRQLRGLTERLPASLAKLRNRDDRSGNTPGIDSVRRETRAIARTVDEVRKYDIRAAATTRRLAAHQQRASRYGLPWYAGERGAGLATEIDGLAADAQANDLTPLVVLPPELVRARWERRRDRRRRSLAHRMLKEVEEALTARSALRKEALQRATWLQGKRRVRRGYQTWRTKADRVRALAAKMCRREAHYRLHVNDQSDMGFASSPAFPKRFLPTATADSWQQFQATVAELQETVERDDRIREVERIRQSRYRRGAILRREIPFYRKGYDAFVRELLNLECNAPPGETPPDWNQVLGEHWTQAGLRRDVTKLTTEWLPQLKALPGRRRALVKVAGRTEKGFLDSGDHADWTADAEQLTAAAQRLLDGAKQFEPHLKEAGVQAASVQQALDPVRRTLERDRKAKAVLADWCAHVQRAHRWRPPARRRAQREPDASPTAVGRTPFFEDGHDALIERVRATHEETRQYDEIVPEFAAALCEHEQLNAVQQQDVDPLVKRIRACTLERRQLLEAAADDRRPFRVASPENHAIWEQLGAEAEDASGDLVKRIKALDPHLRRDPASWPTIRHSRFEAFASRDLGELPARLLLRLHDHGAACANRVTNPYLDRGLATILNAMREPLARTDRPVSALEYWGLERGIKPLEMLVDMHKAQSYYDHASEGRAELEKDAADKGCAIVEAPGYQKWRKQAEYVRRRTHAILLSPANRPALDRWPEYRRVTAQLSNKLRGWFESDDNHPVRVEQRLQKQKADLLRAEPATPAQVRPRPKPRRRRKRKLKLKPKTQGDGVR